MVMATVRYCEDCTVTIYVPGGADASQGVTIAARDTLRLRVSPARQQLYQEIQDWQEVGRQVSPPPPPLPPRWTAKPPTR